jgi:hypothetical protein
MGAKKMENVGNGSRTMAIEVCFSLILLLSLILIFFRFRQVRQNQWAMSCRIGKARQLGTWFFFSFTTRIAY